jgi:hypothetical protein
VPTDFIPFNIIIFVPANDTTIYLSSTVGSSANFLLLQNVSSLPIDYEVTIDE